MSKILVYYSQLNIGGAEKSLIRLMNAFASEGDDVTYLGRYGQGKGEYLLDNRIRRVSLSSCQPALEGGLRAYLTNLKLLLERCVSLLKLRFGPHSYDIALIGLQGLSPNVVVNNTRSKKIAVFIRTDVSQMKGNNRVIKTLRKNERMVDYYICVAQTVRNSLVKEIPEVESKAIVVYNLLNVDEMRNNLQIAPNPFSDENTKVFRILSVCRISKRSISNGQSLSDTS